jgi:hypothetical protein
MRASFFATKRSAWFSIHTHSGDTIMGTKVTDNYFEYNGQKYFRRNAHVLDLGSFGEKKDSAFAPGFLEEHGTIKAEYLAPRAEVDVPVTIDWNNVSQGDIGVGVNLKFFGIGVSTAQSISLSDAKSGNLQLVPISIPEGKVVSMLNEANVARNFLADEGNDGRVLSMIWVLMQGTLASEFSASANNDVTVKAFGQSVSITVSGGKSGTQTIQMSPGATFAYRLHKVKKWTDNKKTKVESVEADYKGIS